MKPVVNLFGLLAGLCGLVIAADVLADQGNTAFSLAGEWHVRLDSEDVGVQQRWYGATLASAERIQLPGTTDQAGLGHALDIQRMRYPAPFPYTRFPGVAEPERADARGFLVRPHFFLGPVWYEKEIQVPEAWQDQWIRLTIERALWQTDAWVDGQHVGQNDSLVASHEHRLGRLIPGRHRLTLRVDNRMIHNLTTIPHGYGPETQSRWNGLIGRIELQAEPELALRRLDAFPAADRRSVKVVSTIQNAGTQPGQGRLQLRMYPETGGRILSAADVAWSASPGPAQLETVLSLEAAAQPWDEFKPIRYRLEAKLTPSSCAVSKRTVLFGFRHIERQGRAILVNGHRVFLRGTLDCAVYPRTGHPPMTILEWERVLRTVKQYGFNHVRFHTWCPPEAAFEAADRVGVYLMPETVAWVDDWTLDTFSQPPAVGKNDAINAFTRAEIRRISEAYGNHPSFALFCIGNEFGMNNTDWNVVASWTAEAKQQDNRRLYTSTTARRSLAPDDFWVTHAANGKATRGVGPAQTDWDFHAAAAATDLPLLAHETGQRPVFPDYDEWLPKFTGPLRPMNYQRLQGLLMASGLAGQVKDFERASARFQFVQYKAEHEAMRRTTDYAGYQLLMLNDFTGQSEALVGILDPFWETKGVVSAAQVRAWNSATVPLARFASYTWNTTDQLKSKIELAHHGRLNLENVIAHWELRADRGDVLGKGRLGPQMVKAGEITTMGDISVSLRKLDRASALTLRVRAAGATNSWKLWAYPATNLETKGQVLVTNQWGQATQEALAAGSSVLLLAHGVRNEHAAQTGFESVYWSAGWWGNAFSSLGILCDPKHPALAEFPNDGHSDWQWRELLREATTFRMGASPAGFRPIVQPVPDFHFCQMLAQVFEVRVGPGRLLVCGYDLTTDLEKRPVARQFRYSLMRYMSSEKFSPTNAFSEAQLSGMLRGK
jgi:beta-galactosidase